ncbi:MAG TPA: 4-alpha-glucanotransferase [Planctomycetota bacterium]|nr:4-alpha-glucanotransferase [Planctomycetota bacterium]
MFPRSAGLLLHVTSLPGGKLGPEAYRFVDFLAAAGQRWWQVLPLGPPARHSPYDALSAFAGNEALVDGEGPPLDAPWAEEYATFRALRDLHRKPWPRWPRRTRAPEEAVSRYLRRQGAFDAQWGALKRYANERGIGIIGDLPIFVAHESADVWAHRDLFNLDRRGRPRVVTGVPPDYFSRTGQRWGNPHYRWDVLRRRRYRWWIARLRRAFELFDAVRIDHFLGFLRAWEIPARARDGRKGRWAGGPGADFFTAVWKALGPRPLIAEDLGLLTPEAAALRDRFGLPGMRVLHFSFGWNPEDRPHYFPRNSVVFTGTHDNDTTRGWFRAGGADTERARRYALCRGGDIHWGMIRVAHLAASDLAIIPVQDLLGLGSEARMNRPGKVRGNWRWQLEKGALTRRLARQLREVTEASGRTTYQV